MNGSLLVLLSCSLILGSIGCVSTKHIKTTLPEQPKFEPVKVGMPGKGKMPAYAAGRMAAFAKEDISKLQGRTVFVGASGTERYPLDIYFPGIKTVNRGIGGDTMGGWYSWGLLDRLESSVYNLNPKKLVLLIGNNDVIWITTQSTEDKILCHEYLLWKLKKDLPDTQIYVVSCTPCRGKLGKYNDQILKFNAGIKSNAQKYGIPFIDLHDLFLDEHGQLKAELAADDIHLTPAGYEIMTRVYKKEIFGMK